jgi:hypothetical protein
VASGGWTQDETDITIPIDATLDDPRVFVGQNDPILIATSQDAGIVFYFADDRAFVLSVEQSGSPDDGQLHLFGVAGIGQGHGIMDVDFDVVANYMQVGMCVNGIAENTDFQVFAKTMQWGDSLLSSKEDSDVQIYGESMPRGFHASAGSSANQSVTVAAGETLAFATAGEDYVANRAYRVYLKGGVRSAATNGAAQMRIRKTGVGGQDLGEYYRTGVQLANTVYGTHGQHEFTVGATTVTASIALTVQANVNTMEFFATATSPREIVIEDVGAASKYPFAPVLV